MANLSLIGDDTTGLNSVYMKGVLEDLGHTVSVVKDTDVTASNLIGYDVIITSSCAVNETVSGYLRGYIDDGVPVIVGYINALSEGNPNTLGQIRMATTAGNLWYSQTYLVDESHPVTAPLEPPVAVTICGGSAIKTEVNPASSYVGTVLGRHDSGAGSKIDMIAVESGTDDLDGNPFVSRCGFIGWCCGRDSRQLTSAAKGMLDRFIHWCAGASTEITELEDAALTLTAAAWQLDDTGLWLSATDGTVLADLPARLEAAWYSLENLSAPLAACLQDLEDVPAYLTTVARVLLDAPLSLQAQALAIDDLPAALRACAQRLDDFGLYLSATDAQVLHDIGVYLTATDGAMTDDLSLRLAAVRNAPRYVSSIAHRVSSVVRDVT